LYAVRERRGGPWDWARGLREQAGFDDHARFMDGLVEAGFVLLGGPLEGDREVLLVVSASSADGIFGDRERITRMEELALNQESGVHDQRDVRVDERVIHAVDVYGEAGDLQRVPVPHFVHPVAELGELRADRLVGPQGHAGVAGQRGAYRVGVEVVGVLVGDQHRAGPVQGRGRVAPPARVEDQNGTLLLQPDA
jgi:hypothetical protein